jgi:hypothetical protein
MIAFHFYAFFNEREYDLTVNVRDDGRPFVELADDAEQLACNKAARHFGHHNFEIEAC